MSSTPTWRIMHWHPTSDAIVWWCAQILAKGIFFSSQFFMLGQLHQIQVMRQFMHYVIQWCKSRFTPSKIACHANKLIIPWNHVLLNIIVIKVRRFDFMTATMVLTKKNAFSTKVIKTLGLSMDWVGWKSCGRRLYLSSNLIMCFINKQYIGNNKNMY